MTDEPKEGRAHTMSKIALRRLSRTEIVGLGIGLAAIEECEADLLAELAGMRMAAEKEAQARRMRDLPGLGPYGRAFLSVKRLSMRLGLARVDTEVPLRTGKVERR